MGLKHTEQSCHFSETYGKETHSSFLHGPSLSCLLHVCMLSCFSHLQLCANLQTVAHQTPLSMGFSRQEYWSGFPFPSPRDLLNPGIKTASYFLHWQACSLPLAPLGSPFLSLASINLGNDLCSPGRQVHLNST